MIDANITGALLTAMVAAPGLTFLALALAWMLGWTPPEKFVARLTAVVSLAIVITASWLSFGLLVDHSVTIQADFGDWFRIGAYSFPLSLFVDSLSLPLVLLTSMLIGIVGTFSVRYIHRERGFFRFFLLLHLFSFGALLTLAAGSFDLLVIGWELVGITSVLLVAFFDERREPVRNAIRVYATYKIADLGLLLAVFVLHASIGSTEYGKLFHGEWPLQSIGFPASIATCAALLLLWGASGKSAQLPFSGWLPRAMEGPTPSSAIFYGAVAVHLGAYLLLRSQAILAASPVAAAIVILVGAITALQGTLSHRVVSDAKTSIAYAAMTQLGVIFVEIGLGFPRFALLHIVGHMIVRTLQFLRAPSALHDYHQLHAAAAGDLGTTGDHYNKLLPEGLRLWLYRAGLERGFYDAAVDRLILQPLFAVSRALARLQPSRSLPSSQPIALPFPKASARETNR